MQQLDFTLLDDLALAVQRRDIPTDSTLREARIARIGPLLELVVLTRSSGKWTLDSLLACPAVNQLRATLTQRSSSGNHDTNGTGRFILTSRNLKDDDPMWTSFCYHAQRAAESSGMPAIQARGLIGAMREIEENVHMHSERSHDGIVGYRATKDDFEFVVADSGIGTLGSFRKSPDYSQLRDPGTAIRLAVTDGESRLRYKEKGRGYGFHDLFVGLANLNGNLRFRSDDHALTLDGTSPSLLTARLSQTAPLQGFIASVVCSVQGRGQVH
jgi:hypothetical protein